MPTISYDKRQEIKAQAIKEIAFARQYKQGKIANWKLNEQLYYSRKVTPTESRANVDLGQMSSFVHTLLSKIDAPLIFRFTKRKEAQLNRVKQLNALRTFDQGRDNWDIKDIAGKKQGLIYGRAIYSYFADSMDTYKPHLDNVDVYDFLIDPSCGGIDIEKANFLGDYGVVKTRDQLKRGMKAGDYLKTETQCLLDGSGNNTERPQEEMNKQDRIYDTNISTPQREMQSDDKFKFWRWGTTFEGKRYFVLLTEQGNEAIEITELTEKFASNLWWYWTWAAFVDLTEFWSPSYCDYVRDVFMAQAVSINQALDNAEQINKPQKVVNVGAIENLAELKYRKDGIIKVKKEFNADQALQTIKVPSIDTPFKVFQILDGIQEKASGVTGGSYGGADNGSGAKATIYNGNQANSADRFGLLNRSYSFGYKHFAKLYEHGVREHLLKKIAVDILGPEGVSMIEVSRRDIFRKNEEFGIMVEASNAETALSEEEKKTKLEFLSSQASIATAPGGTPPQNQKKAYEIMASIAGFDEDTIRQLQDTSNYGDAELMSEAERDIERLLDGEKFNVNQGANTAYKQRFVDYMQEHDEDITQEQFAILANYVLLLDPVIYRNMTRQANDMLMKQQIAQASMPQPVDPNAPPMPTSPIIK